MQETQVHVIPLYGAGVDLAVHTSEVDDALWVGDAEEPSGRLWLYIGSHCLRMQFAFDSRRGDSRLAITEIQISFSINLELNQNDFIIRSIPFDTIRSMKCLRTLQSLYFIYPGEYITLYQTQRTALKSYYKDREKLIAQLSSEKANMQVSNKITIVIFSDVMRCSIVEVEKSTDWFRKCSRTCKPLWNIA